MTAQEAKSLYLKGKKATPEVLERINNSIKDAIKTDCNTIYLSFDEYGNSYDDVDWLKEYGYSIMRNGACLWWEVSW